MFINVSVLLLLIGLCMLLVLCFVIVVYCVVGCDCLFVNSVVHGPCDRCYVFVGCFLIYLFSLFDWWFCLQVAVIV